MDQFHLIIVTGMSGAGKSQAVKVLEDIGYFCIDNLPPVLIPKFAELCVKGGERVRHVALIADIRGGQFFDAMSQALQELRKQGVSYEIVFMEASDKVLINRYKETRRVHPLALHGRISQGIAEERKRLATLREQADFIIDTSSLKTSQLRDILRKRYALNTGRKGLTVTVVSFGFKHGMPIDADIVDDVRFLPNPYYVEEYRHKSGRVPVVRDYVQSFQVTQTFKEKWFDMIDFLLPNYEREGKSQLVIAVGCTGGMHRSVCMAEEMYRHLKETGVDVSIEHRDLAKNDVEEDAPGYEGEDA
ncbi:RNase adapter RapZ [Megasphaera hexanoica]|uniref:RNase adapter RapZ n=1 Tax=Megasphaera hexanoica TaxID=1675036 RepID=A0ABW7DS43_9FIRM|nr:MULTISPECIES: RNase adapter RapZ [Megasphaera]MCI5532930.1 RNase adapter RapZ [Caecibacter massiliensis]HAM04046.1 RNase adapter RapZ [Megasphaera sp.]AXB80919.1 glmZ(sRNA)-inactivating NTPase [Megasphaera hexanoica]KUH56685.1 glmZ(sRNA)-inactivating NTPase [Megasphaera sp. DJF_B143]MDY2904293.1 RNase adapter RapZ [Caecibacter massiliensis]